MTAKPSKRTDIANLDSQLQQRAAALKGQIAAGASSRITIDKAGNFTLPDGANLGPDVDVVVIEFLSINLFYDRQYDPNNPVPPACYAIHQELSEMEPAEDSPVKQADNCASCPNNVFGSRGNGKLCKNTRRLAVVLAEQAGDPSAPIYEVNVSPTSLKSFDGFVSYALNHFNTPPVGVVVKMSAVQNGTYTNLSFDASSVEKNDHVGVCFARSEEALNMIDRAPDVSKYVPPQQRPAPKTAARPARR